MIGSKKPRPGECISCGTKEPKLLQQHCPKSATCNWTRCLHCHAITAVVKGQLKAIAGKT